MPICTLTRTERGSSPGPRDERADPPRSSTSHLPSAVRFRITMELLDNPVRRYAWGSRTVIADLLGREVPSPHPEAELWLGAHPGDPSHLATGKSLVEAISADPEGQLGADRADRWDEK